MPASLGKECYHTLNLGHILPPHRHLCFVKCSRNYSRLCQHPQQSACTAILPWHAIFTALLARQGRCRLGNAGRVPSRTPGTRGRITTFLTSLCCWFFDPVLLPHNVARAWILNASKMHYKSLRKLTDYACMSQLPSPWSLDPSNLKSPHRYVYVQDLCIAALSWCAAAFYLLTHCYVLRLRLIVSWELLPLSLKLMRQTNL